MTLQGGKTPGFVSPGFLLFGLRFNDVDDDKIVRLNDDDALAYNEVSVAAPFWIDFYHPGWKNGDLDIVLGKFTPIRTSKSIRSTRGPPLCLMIL